jgi:hypothetical protein
MNIIRDMIGQTVGYLTVFERAPNKGKHTAWRCRCVCGTVRTVEARSLRRGATKSCGCMRFKLISDARRNKRGKERATRHIAFEDALREVSQGWAASLAKRAREARRVRV